MVGPDIGAKKPGNEVDGGSGAKSKGSIRKWPKIVRSVAPLLLVMGWTFFYLAISHLVFFDSRILKSHVAVILVDSFVATVLAYFVFRRMHFLSSLKDFEHRRSLDIMRFAEVYNRNLIETSLDPLVTISTEGKISDVNTAAESVTGRQRKELIGTDFAEYVTEPEKAKEGFERVFREGTVRDFELTIRHREGRLTPVLYNASVYRDDQGDVIGVFAAARDMSRFKEAQKELYLRNQELLVINAIARTLNQSLDVNVMLRSALTEMLELGIFAGEAGGMIFLGEEGTGKLVAAVHRGIPDDHPCLALPVNPGECLCGLAFEKDELVISHEKEKDGRYTRRCPGISSGMDLCIPLRARNDVLGILYLSVSGRMELTDRDKDILVSIGGQLGVAIDNGRLFLQVKEQHTQLKDLTSRLLEAEEAERRELSRELHDRVGQNLTALGLNLNILKAKMEAKMGPTAGPMVSRVDDSLHLVGETTARIRDVMAELRPPVLDDYGILSALQWYGTQFFSRTGIAVKVKGNDHFGRLDVSTENTLFRIAQEALTNVAKHSHAREVNIALDAPDRTIRMVIADNGIGFDVQHPLDTEHGGSWGLLTMKERALAAGGSCRIQSSPGKGTQIIVEIDR